MFLKICNNILKDKNILYQMNSGNILINVNYITSITNHHQNNYIEISLINSELFRIQCDDKTTANQVINYIIKNIIKIINNIK